MARSGGKKFDDDELHWYALDVVRQKEYVAGHILQRMGCMTFIPTETRFRKQNRYRKGKIEVAYPAIPGMVFAGFDGAPDWYRVMNMHLVNGVLSLDNQPRRIDTSNKEWIWYRGHQLDGSLVIEKQRMRYKGEDVNRSVSLVHIQGRGVLRSPLSIKAKASTNRPVVITAAGERARRLGAIIGAQNVSPQPVRAAA